MQIMERQTTKLLMSTRLWWVVLVAWWSTENPIRSLSLQQKDLSLLTHFAPLFLSHSCTTYLVIGWIMTRIQVSVTWMNQVRPKQIPKAGKTNEWMNEWNILRYRTWYIIKSFITANTEKTCRHPARISTLLLTPLCSGRDSGSSSKQ